MPSLDNLIHVNSEARRLDNILSDPFLRTLFSGIFKEHNLDMTNILNPLEVDTLLDYGVTTYKLCPTVASAIGLEAIRLAQVIFCAANDHNPYTTPKPLTYSIQTETLLSIDMTEPPILYHRAVFDSLSSPFESYKELWLAVQHSYMLLRETQAWIVEALKRSLAHGLTSKFSWGSYWGIPWDVFVGRIGYIVDCGARCHTSTSLSGLLTSEPEYPNIECEGALVLHPTESNNARALKESANKILKGDADTFESLVTKISTLTFSN